MIIVFDKLKFRCELAWCREGRVDRARLKQMLEEERTTSLVQGVKSQWSVGKMTLWHTFFVCLRALSFLLRLRQMALYLNGNLLRRKRRRFRRSEWIDRFQGSIGTPCSLEYRLLEVSAEEVE